MEPLKKISKFFNVPLEAMESCEPPITIPGKGRWALADLFRILDYKIGVEVGVECGAYSAAMCRKNPGVKLYAVDAWKAYRGYRDHVNQDKLERFCAEAKVALEPFDATIIRKFSHEAVRDFKDNSLDFVFLDANHDFFHITEDLHKWGKKIRPGGIISGHDYTLCRQRTVVHVYAVVNAYTKAYGIKPWFVLGEDVEGSARTFFWIKNK